MRIRKKMKKLVCLLMSVGMVFNGNIFTGYSAQDDMTEEIVLDEEGDTFSVEDLKTVLSDAVETDDILLMDETINGSDIDDLCIDDIAYVSGFDSSDDFENVEVIEEFAGLEDIEDISEVEDIEEEGISDEEFGEAELLEEQEEVLTDFA